VVVKHRRTLGTSYGTGRTPQVVVTHRRTPPLEVPHPPPPALQTSDDLIRTHIVTNICILQCFWLQVSNVCNPCGLDKHIVEDVRAGGGG
jgi:hypothetical protein